MQAIETKRIDHLKNAIGTFIASMTSFVLLCWAGAFGIQYLNDKAQWGAIEIPFYVCSGIVIVVSVAILIGGMIFTINQAWHSTSDGFKKFFD